MTALSAASEQARLDALARYDILDTPNESVFDRITSLVCRIFAVPMATVTFLDAHRQWFKSRQGVADCEGDRGPAFCNLTIRQSEPLIVTDTHQDGRFAGNPLVLGPPFLRFYAGIPLRSAEGQNIGTLCAMGPEPRAISAEEIAILSDLAGIVMEALELRLLATTDGLTGALSRRAFRDEGARTLALAQRHRHEASCIALDLDHFKSVNDTHGHAAGDAVLFGTVAACRRLLRQTDLIGRVGGEEFAVLLPYTDRQAALGVAEKLRSGIAAESFDGSEGPFKVSASFGVATVTPGVSDLDSLLALADAALYRAKSEGRNRCIAAPATDSASVGRRVLKAGQIVFNGGRSAIDCTVKRLSEDGASLAVLSTAGVPERFKLAIAADGFSKTCAIARKAGSEIDVQFA
ncbi:sensor domain-containing diguanylate cyclase [Bosea beijingensis]|uniref:sensor domain-containing diguanylate cyclase n=1 Tax=Bosea beijingensis TaxID=3068632 RepID=UPI002740B892|nr:sensor domain-containing diguanylate cyclase [Bosea sp. REN20]